MASLSTVTVARYLSTRLHQLGVRHLFGVPGDFNLTLLDLIEEAGQLAWVGSPNELNAGYAADGYARCRGLGALVTTYGVGELSCINAVAGSYAENVPVVQITGSPATAAVRSKDLLHHTLADGDFGHFQRAYQEVTAAAEVLSAGSAPDQIDRVLGTAIRQLRPVYLSVPVDVAAAPVPAGRLAEPIGGMAADLAAVRAFRERAGALLAEGSSVVVVAGHLVQRQRLEAPLRALAEAGGLRVATLLSSKGAFDEDHELFAGVYCGGFSGKRARLAVEESDVVINVGTLMTDAVSGGFTHRDDPDHTVALGVTSAQVGSEVFDGVPVGTALDVLDELVGGRRFKAPGAVAEPVEASRLPDENQGLTQSALWRVFGNWLPSGYRVLAEIGTSFWGAAEVAFPADTSFVAQPVWSSIGYVLPAALGCATAEPDRRVVVVIGDGAAQMTAQEISTLATHATNAIIIVVNNSGYTIERALQSPNARYNDIPRWEWGDLARALAPGRDVLALTATTGEELRAALRRAEAAVTALSLVEVITAQLDVPPMLQTLANAVNQGQ